MSKSNRKIKPTRSRSYIYKNLILNFGRLSTKTPEDFFGEIDALMEYLIPDLIFPILNHKYHTFFDERYGIMCVYVEPDNANSCGCNHNSSDCYQKDSDGYDCDGIKDNGFDRYGFDRNPGEPKVYNQSSSAFNCNHFQNIFPQAEQL